VDRRCSLPGVGHLRRSLAYDLLDTDVDQPGETARSGIRDHQLTKRSRAARRAAAQQKPIEAKSGTEKLEPTMWSGTRGAGGS
jgi:hypothetical protein